MTERQLTLGVNLLTAAVVVSVAVALAGLTWRLAGEPGGKPSPVAPVPIVIAAAPVDITPILALAPFGAAPAAIANGAGGSSTDGLVLRGIVRAVPAWRSTALIAAAGASATPFAVGETLPGGAVVDAISVDHVLLRVNGRQEVLTFPQRASAADAAGVAAIRAALPASVLGIAPGSAGSPTTAPPLNSAAATGAAIEQYRDRLAASPQTLIGSLGATASPKGYVVGATPSPQMRQAGLQPGDVVEKVNGVAVGEPERDRRLFDDAVASGRARVEILRDGRRITLSFPLR